MQSVDGSLVFTLAKQLSDTAFVYATTLAASAGSVDTELTLQVQATDAFGNSAVTTLDDAGARVHVDTVPPSPPAVGASGAFVLQRTPWGSEASGGNSALVLQAAAGSLTPGTTLLALDRADASTAVVLARADYQATSLQLPLSSTDRRDVFVATLDGAGNLSDADLAAPGIQAERVREGEWIATFGQSAAGNQTANPHRVELTANVQEALSQSDEPVVPGQVDLDALASPDGVGPFVTLTSRWNVLEAAIATRPMRRTGSALVYDPDRDRVVLFGGLAPSAWLCGEPTQDCGDTWEWDRVQWKRRSSPTTPPSARFSHAMAYDSLRRRVVLFGGQHTSNTYHNDVWTWNGTRWTEITPPSGSPQGRAAMRMAYDTERDRMVIHGGHTGFSGDCNASGFQTCSDTREWNGTAWLPQRNFVATPGRRHSYGIAYDSKAKRIVLFGGYAYGSSGADCEGVGAFDASCNADDLWEYNGEAWRDITPAGTKPAPRGSAGVAYDQRRDAVVVFGGYTNGGARLSDVWALSRDAFVQRQSMPVALSSFSATYDSLQGAVLAFGGVTPATSECTGGTCDDLWSFDGRGWGRFPYAKVPAPRTRATLVYDALRARSVLFGGQSSGDCDSPGSGAICQDMWEWNGRGWLRVVPAGPLPEARTAASAAYVDTGTLHGVLLFGGYQSPGSCDSGVDCTKTWLYDGVSWQDVTPTDPARSPTPRYNAAMAFDPATQHAVLFGGMSSSACTPIVSGHCGDTWEWGNFGALYCLNGETHCWRKAAPASTPSPRYDHAMTHDPVGGGILLFGGAFSPGGPTTVYADTWRFSGGTWLPLSPATSVPGRGQHAMVTDEERQRVLMWGGATGGLSTYLLELWQWDGSDFAPLALNGLAPAGKAMTATTYDAARGALFVFSGASVYGQLSHDSSWIGTPTRQRPGAGLAFHWHSAGIDETQVSGIEARVVAQGSGAKLDGASLGGAQLSVWDARTKAFRWRADAVSGASTLISSDAGYASAARWLERDGYVHLIVRALAGSGRNIAGGQLLLDYAELHLRYDLGANAAVCGDGTLQSSEMCDDGDTSDAGNGCSGSCTRSGFCGDGVVQDLFEQCEPANTASCDSACQTLNNACCQTHLGAGCIVTDASTESCVCAVDPACCSDGWDERCVATMQALGCGVCP